MDESYKDPTNLESKMQKHQAFEAEIAANKARMDAACKVMKIQIYMYMYLMAIHLIVTCSGHF